MYIAPKPSARRILRAAHRRQAPPCARAAARGRRADGAGGGRRAPQRPSQRQQGIAEVKDFFSIKTWCEVGAAAVIQDALDRIGISRPSHVQAAAYPAILEGDGPVIVADCAGSGKTLAYLLPIVQRLHSEELEHGRRTKASSPRAIVVCPTAELCAQALLVCRALSQVIKLRCAAFTGGHKPSTQAKMLQEGIDIAICTPGRLGQLLDLKHLSFEQCQVLVLDEVDVLMGEQGAFDEQMLPIVQAVPGSTRCVLVTATLPGPTLHRLQASFPGMKAVLGPNLHRVISGVTEQLVDCSGGTDFSLQGATQRKLLALGIILRRHVVPRTIVFCNKIESCRAVENFLNRGAPVPAAALTGESSISELLNSAPQSDSSADESDGSEAHIEPSLPVPATRSDARTPERGASGSPSSQGRAPDLRMKVVAHHAAIGAEHREANLRRFLSPASDVSGDPMVLVCTDRASRGIDTAHVRHVVLFDFPRDASEYVRRAGRTGRGAIAEGLVSLLVLGRQVPIAQKLLSGNQKGQPVFSIPAL